jgi:hypothetical protein
MWIVKRMSIARIVVLTIALSAGGVAAHVSGSGSKPLPTELVARSLNKDVPEQSGTLAPARQTATLSPTPSSKSSKGRAI